MIKPIIVYVSGAPGSGKTTLARLIAEQLYVPNVSSDLIHGGVALSQPNHDRRQTLKDVFVPTMVDMSKKGISFVVDHVLQQGVSEADIIDVLRSHANIVNIHTQCANPIERYIKRVQESNLPSVVERREHLLNLAVPHGKNLNKTSEPLNLELPLLIVDTNDGYEPSINQIISFIREKI